jgi:sugar phosphate isomerase/epimerase
MTLGRRQFLHLAGAFAAADAFSPIAAMSNPLHSSAPIDQSTPPPAARRYKMGLQLFTIRRPLAADVDGTLKRVAALGYEEVESYGFDPATVGYYGMPAKAFATRLSDLGMVCVSGHYDLNKFATASDADLHGYVDRCIEGAKALGQSYITWPLIDEPSKPIEQFKKLVARLNPVGERITKAGLQFAWHNHGYEFVPQDGQVPYDIILKETDPALVKLQVDLYWLAHDSKDSPHEWFTRAPGRYEMWHVKDMHKVTRDYTELGNGTIDYTRIWPDTKLAGMKHFFVEQGGNFTHDPMRSIEDCAAYVKRYLLT